MRPSYSFFLFLIAVSVVIAWIVLQVMRQQQQRKRGTNPQGGTPLSWLDYKKTPEGKTRRELLKMALKSQVAMVMFALIAIGAIFELVMPSWYDEWVGGKNGWAIFFAALISLPLASTLIQKPSLLLKIAGWFILIVGFLGPLLTTTRPVQWVVEKYEEVWLTAPTSAVAIRTFELKYKQPLKIEKKPHLRLNASFQKACVLKRGIGSERKPIILCDKGLKPDFEPEKGLSYSDDDFTEATALEFTLLNSGTIKLNAWYGPNT